MRRIRHTIWIILLAAALVPLARVEANSAPPPGEVWFFLQEVDGASLRPAGVQMWGCSDAACTQATAIQQWGVCDAAGCLPAPTPQQGMESLGYGLECARDVCRSRQFQYSAPYFKLAVQMNARLYVEAQAHELPDTYGEKFYWNVNITGGELHLSPADGMPKPSLPVPPFFAFFGLTILVEMLVVGVYSAWRWKLDMTAIIIRLLIVAVINLLTYPVVWGFFPELLRFGLPGMRSFGWLLTAYLLALGLLLALAINAKSGRLRTVWIVAGALLLAGGGLCMLVGLFSAGYGYPAVALTGLPVWLVLLLAEGYAVVVETMMLFAFTRREIDLRLSFLLSLGMNAASFLIGLLLAWGI